MTMPDAAITQRRTAVVGRYFAAAAAFLLAGAVGLAWAAPELARGMFLDPRVAGTTHLFTLGFLTLTIFGALGQLLPVALGATRYSARVAGFALWLLAPGIAAFAAGVITGNVPALVGGAVLVGFGVSIAATNAAVAMLGVRERSVTRTALLLGHLFLLAALVFGLVLSGNLYNGLIAAARIRVLAGHLHIALVGWVLIVVIGVAHRVLPMFLAAPKAPRPWTGPSVTLLAIGTPLLAAGLVEGVTSAAWTGCAAMDAGLALFLVQTVGLYRRRTRPALGVGMWFVAAGMAGMTAAGVLGPAVLAAGVHDPRLATAYGVCAILGGLVPFVTGIMYEIVPVVSWNVRFAGRLNRGPVPKVTELYSRGAARWQLGLTVAGVAAMGGGIAAASPEVARLGAGAFLAAVVVFVSQLIRMRWRLPAPAASRMAVS
ncbi:MAG: hypothetical protein KGO03_04400 [Gemmatimonadota bacterium]|nr:hypothetical protein [Gemmatimonadota bacterium]